MKTKDFTRAIDKLVDIKMKAVNRFIEEFAAPLGDIGSPEKLIHKKYEEWTPQDLTMLTTIYGAVEPNPLSELIFRKEYEKTKALEAEVG